MEAIKPYTDLEQSRKLAEILPAESADGFWEYHDRWRSEGDDWEGYEDYPRAEPYLEYTRNENEWKQEKQDIPCWSLAALLGAIKKYGLIDLRFLSSTFDSRGEHLVNVWCCTFDNINTVSFDFYADNPIDVCYEMILKLHELKML